MKRHNTIFTPIVLLTGCLGLLLTKAFGVVPPPDGGYPGGNTAEGQNALLSLTTGGFNTGIGYLSLRSNTSNSFNTAVGAATLVANTADQNTAVGAGALLGNSGGGLNTANGAFALFSNTGGNVNTGTGVRALFSNSTGDGNTAMGTDALLHNTTADGNTAFGTGALFTDTTGSNNTAVGNNALVNNSGGSGNIALGAFAGGGVTTVSNVICIGSNVGGANVANSCFIGNIRDALVAPDAATVLIDSAGKLGTTTGSSRRFKKDIKPMDNASEAVLALKPVTFYYTGDSTNTPQFGLIAEDVVEINPELTVRDKTGELLTVRYDAVNAMLLNEFLKEHRKVEEQQATIAQLKNEMVTVVARLKEHESKIQRVSAQIEVSKAAGQTTFNNP